jgi:predicted nucleic acid-binding Zn ribbon protein
MLIETKLCKQCGSKYETSRSNQLFCSPECRNVAQYQKKKQKLITMQERLKELEQLKLQK